MLIEFRVDGFPPRNHRGMSMWALKDQAPRVIALRQQALQARTQASMSGPIREAAGLSVEIYVPQSRLWLRGDLDSLLAGVGDTLQGAPSNARPHTLFAAPDFEGVSPALPILLHNDSHLVAISARGHVIAESQEPFYTVSVEWATDAPS